MSNLATALWKLTTSHIPFLYLTPDSTRTKRLSQLITHFQFRNGSRLSNPNPLLLLVYYYFPISTFFALSQIADVYGPDLKLLHILDFPRPYNLTPSPSFTLIINHQISLSLSDHSVQKHFYFYFYFFLPRKKKIN